MKDKTNLSKAHKPVVTDRFYYGIAPRGEYYCKGCQKRHIGCHVDCPEYNAEKAIDIKRRQEELKRTAPVMSRAMEKKLRKKMLDERRRK